MYDLHLQKVFREYQKGEIELSFGQIRGRPGALDELPAVILLLTAKPGQRTGGEQDSKEKES